LAVSRLRANRWRLRRQNIPRGTAESRCHIEWSIHSDRSAAEGSGQQIVFAEIVEYIESDRVEGSGK